MRSAKLLKRLALAASLTTFVSACGRSGSPELVIERPPLPAMPAELSQPCPQLDVAEDAFEALVSHRTALAECRARHLGAVRFYRDVRTELGG